ncbi:LPXTG-site transpeptidase (sortase) family protein [Sediminihabitans luteus]|uniref:LPXTG-site transpeptidase (Sortase) family protein n=1 Tax=Sediminihabitans luteus TaxID=1138585 RepID=A0A2M9D0J6_9CELL|nr:class F sortase [Sediminihabitans luteus]PJJ77721.1 LPXTG-site transpeptidase (sortase) family protein [Sediminihabitans luteus]GIJ00052.1 hypothetical protein Slu03_24290 [Sediminihabitans luteus]
MRTPDATRPAGRRLPALALVTAGLAAAFVALGILLLQSAGAGPSVVAPATADGPPDAGASASPTGAPAPGSTRPAADDGPRPTGVPVVAATLPPVVRQPAPVRLELPALDVDMPVTPVGVDDDGTVGIPESGKVAGWYRYGAVPGSDAGTAVVTSHVDTVADGLGEFARLVDARPGDAVRVLDETGAAHEYTVATVERIAKTDVPLDQVFDRDGPPRLVLVTCGGRWDASIGHYADNVIVTAVP